MDSSEAKRIILEGGYDISDDSRPIEQIAQEILVREAMGEAFTSTVENPEEFAQFVDSKISGLGMSEIDLCDRFDATLTTVRSWRSSEATPQRSVRRRVVVYLGRVELEGFRTADEL